MNVLVFDLRGSMAHFRRPDTTATHASYPFIPRTALRGLLAAILGLEMFEGEAWAGIELLAPVQTSVQEVSMLGKGYLTSGPAMNRPTAIELVVNPAYRIYYHGACQGELARRIREGYSHYHTYLGSAYCLTKPTYVGEWDLSEFTPHPDEVYVARTVVPTHAIARLALDSPAEHVGVARPVKHYGRIGGVHYEYLGERKFRGSIHLIYEKQAGSIVFTPTKGPLSPPLRFVQLEDEVVCLW
ncbi:MAG: CRISPR-associated protein Cas5 [Alicyclobacillus herbarius]|uniref:CRISPR-associated protein Cas5 n=1 Tax=Alicyclobacillus herbarius TaxID=122960 RepID=UPI002355F3C0|nr:CRISPR-associated protein Cas5 [Alicyclobacillus herbarius]MCL6633561.1 CRISPR-associated protein Cas5 [Alicyclobacillus herbarius]